MVGRGGGGIAAKWEEDKIGRGRGSRGKGVVALLVGELELELRSEVSICTSCP